MVVQNNADPWCICLSTLSLAVGKEENKTVFFKRSDKKLIDNCKTGSAPSSVLLREQIFNLDFTKKLYTKRLLNLMCFIQ